MYVSFLTLNILAAAGALGLWLVSATAYSNQCVSDFWGRVEPETNTATYFGLMWLLAASAPALAVADPTVITSVAQYAGKQMQDASVMGVLYGAGIFAVWFTSSMVCFIFAVGVAGHLGWCTLADALRRAKRSGSSLGGA